MDLDSVIEFSEADVDIRYGKV